MDHRGHNESATSPPLTWYPPHQSREDEPGDFSTPPMTPTTASGPLTMPSPILTHSPELIQSIPDTPDAGGPSTQIEAPVATRLSMPLPNIMPPLRELENAVAGPSRRPTLTPLTPASERPPAEAYGHPYSPPHPLPQAPSRERLGRTHSSVGHGPRYESIAINGNGNGMGTPTHPVRSLSYRDNGGRYAGVPPPRDRPMSAIHGTNGEMAESRRSVHLDYIVPEMSGGGDQEKRQSGSDRSAGSDNTVEYRLHPTLDSAENALTKASRQARMTGYALNICIGIQILLGALTTGIAASTSGKHTGIVVAVLGGLSTLAASYLARARGSGEPEESLVRCSELEHFIRDIKAFIRDNRTNAGSYYDREVQRYRKRFEEILGNNQDQQAAKFVPNYPNYVVQDKQGEHIRINGYNV